MTNHRHDRPKTAGQPQPRCARRMDYENVITAKPIQ